MKAHTWVAGGAACGKWADMPAGFDEKVHFIQCCHCRGYMQPMSGEPADFGYTDRQKFEAVLTKQT